MKSKLAHRIYVFWTLFVFGLYVYTDSKGWMGRSNHREERLRRQGARLRERLIRMGPTFIKIGQMLATRADLLPIEYMDELSSLQDNVPAFSNRKAMKLIEEELGRPMSEIFSEISAEPVASASLGQVYRARLLTGEVVAIKVQRPYLAGLVARDLHLLRSIARHLDRFPKLFPGAEWLKAIDEFDRVIHEEMDYRLEAANSIEFKQRFRDWPAIHVPRVYEEFSSGRVLVMEFITGIKVTDLDKLRQAGHDPRKLNELLYRAYFKQLLEDGFFHADPHPGNLLVMSDGRLAIFDFGMVGRISEELQRQMVEAFFHLYNRDIYGIVDDLIGLGFLAPEADVAAIREIVAEVFSRKLNLKLKEVRFKELTYDLAPVIYHHPITTPARFTYLIRAISTLEGISMVMNPDFNFFDVARPFVKDYLLRRDTAQLRKIALESLRDARTGRFEWDRLWTMARMAYSLFVAPLVEPKN
ncbi:MAG TPA: AarF/ABC1/UbiB kinase family protein [Blastocatellia bacterium]|nr:AarF/ABC1/UbiB kinase family protein [Blastocatellia bacterium]